MSFDLEKEEENIFDNCIEEEIEEPPKYKVILYNDDFTTKEFVVEVLKLFFHKSETEAYTIMESVHQKGMGVAGIYTYDIAKTLAQLTVATARENGFPLRCEAVIDN